MKQDLHSPFSYVIYGHMKRFIFRKDWNGFKVWIKSINQMRWTIERYKKEKIFKGGYIQILRNT